MNSIGECRVCGTGPLGLRRCGVCRRVVVLCDECDAAWPSTDTQRRATLTLGGEASCPGCRASLEANGSEWVTFDQAPTTTHQ
ncbi:MAG: hypothetical protein ACRCT8_14215 [Lacipirellulaceae bacterium]